MRVPIKGVNTVKKRMADGTVKRFYYHRATKTPLPGKPGSPEFQEAWAAAERSLTRRDEGTLAGLIRAYSGSEKFAQKAESTQTEYRRMLAKIEGRFGKMPLGAVNDPRVRRDFYGWHEKVAKESGAREADNRLSILSAVLTWGVRRGHIAANHAAGFERLYSVDRSESIWLPEHIDAFNAKAPVALQNALMLALHTGQRQGDVLRMAWGNYDGERISIRQGKTGRRVTIKCTTALRHMLDELPRKATTILTTTEGNPWTARYFQAQWRKTMRAAGLPETLRFHDLRGTAVTMLAQAGCTEAEIAAITGHSLKVASGILDRYLSRTGHLADRAITKLENAR